MAQPSEESHHEEFHVLPDNMGGGPHGLGDPDDRTLRKVEREVVIPKKMKAKAHILCGDLVKKFSDCGRDAGLLMPFKCRKEAKAMQECLGKWFQDPAFFNECKEEYLTERAEYRRTGVTASQKRLATNL